jgi:hypothetical protein
MLRNFVLVVAIALAGSGAYLLLHGEHGAAPMAIWGTILLLAVVFERWRYKNSDHRLSGDWEATDERFIDPESGKLMQVWYQPSTGERCYLPATDDQGA